MYLMAARACVACALKKISSAEISYENGPYNIEKTSATRVSHRMRP